MSKGQHEKLYQANTPLPLSPTRTTPNAPPNNKSTPPYPPTISATSPSMTLTTVNTPNGTSSRMNLLSSKYNTNTHTYRPPSRTLHVRRQKLRFQVLLKSSPNWIPWWCRLFSLVVIFVMGTVMISSRGRPRTFRLVPRKRFSLMSGYPPKSRIWQI